MVDAPEAQRFLSSMEAGRRLSFSDEHVRRLCEKGRFPGAWREGASGRWKVPPEDVEAFIAANRAKVRRRG